MGYVSAGLPARQKCGLGSTRISYAPPCCGDVHTRPPPTPPADLVASPNYGDASRNKFPPDYMQQRVTSLRAGMRPLDGRGMQLRFPMGVSLDVVTQPGARAMARDLLLPENRLGPHPASYAQATSAKACSTCLTQGGGTPGPAGDKERSMLQHNAAVAASADRWAQQPKQRYSATSTTTTTTTSWSPETCKVTDVMGQGRMWDWWHIACLSGASTASCHHDAFPEMMLQWPSEARKGLSYRECREQGIELCNKAISHGIARARQSCCAFGCTGMGVLPPRVQASGKWWIPFAGRVAWTTSSGPTCVGAIAG